MKLTRQEHRKLDKLILVEQEKLDEGKPKEFFVRLGNNKKIINVFKLNRESYEDFLVTVSALCDEYFRLREGQDE
jgi:hypothetical protein